MRFFSAASLLFALAPLVTSADDSFWLYVNYNNYYWNPDGTDGIRVLPAGVKATCAMARDATLWPFREDLSGANTGSRMVKEDPLGDKNEEWYPKILEIHTNGVHFTLNKSREYTMDDIWDHQKGQCWKLHWVPNLYHCPDFQIKLLLRCAGTIEPYTLEGMQ